MIFQPPTIAPPLAERLRLLGELRGALGGELDRPARWIGSLRRQVQASSIGSSTSIEGYSVSPEEALALANGEEPGEDDDRLAVASYARAMDHVAAMVADPGFRWLDRVILDLHFDACHFQPGKAPGRWRTSPIGVTAADGSIAYQAPEAERVPELMTEIVDWLQDGSDEVDPFVRAALAHLNVTSVHPFRDGNGRVARIVQSLALAERGMTAPEFFSIEEFLGAHTAAYYAALESVQGGRYQPQRDTSGWISFCVEAHIAQARQRLNQIGQAAARWGYLEEIVSNRDWPERLTIALEQSLSGSTDRARYGSEAAVSAPTASGDFRRLLDAGLVEQRGKGPSTRYVASDSLRAGVPSPGD